MILYVKKISTEDVFECQSVRVVQSMIEQDNLEPDDLIAKSLEGPWRPLKTIQVFEFKVPVTDQESLTNNELSTEAITAETPTARRGAFQDFTNLIDKSANSIQKASQNALKVFDDVIAETRRGINEQDQISITDTLTMGRAAHEVDWVILDPNVALKHLEIKNIEGKLYAVDLKNRIGTFINGERLTPKKETPLADHDLLQVGSASFKVLGQTLISSTRTEYAYVECQNLSRTVVSSEGHEKHILKDVSLTIPPKSFVVFIGPSGSGKSTLLNALNGRLPATSGTVLLNKEDLYLNYSRLRNRIANVPQQDVLHFDLPLETSLMFTAGLKFSSDVDKAESMQIVHRAITEVGMESLKNEPMSTYSGGQIKRASVAHEILSNPSLICVDEATSGLDEHSDREIMSLMRDIADGGKTILCITHNLGNVIEFCDTVVIMAEGGYLAFCGAPNEAIKYFNIDDLSQLYVRLKDHDGKTWGENWSLYSNLALQFVEDEKSNSGRKLKIQRENVTMLQHIGIMLRHGRVIFERIKSLAFKDKNTILITTLQPALVFLVIWILFGSVSQSTDHANVVFLLVVSSFWFGCSNSAKEIVKEKKIFEKERHAGLNAIGYYGAKLIWLFCVTITQSAILLILVKMMTGVNLDLIPGLMALSNISLCGVALGLYISTLSKNNDIAITSVPLAIIPQVVLGGLIKIPTGLAKLIAWISVPCYWIYGYCFHVLKEDMRMPAPLFDNLTSVEVPFTSMIAVMMMSAVLITLSIFHLSGIKVGDEIQRLKKEYETHGVSDRE